MNKNRLSNQLIILVSSLVNVSMRDEQSVLPVLQLHALVVVYKTSKVGEIRHKGTHLVNDLC